MYGGNNGKVLTVSRKLAKILTDSRKSHHPVETLTQGATESQMCYFLWVMKTDHNFFQSWICFTSVNIGDKFILQSLIF